MAAVYRALDLTLDREVAVKLLHKHLASEAESRLRFAREAKAVARLHHENILEIYAYSEEGSAESYLVTEFISGPTLRSYLTEHRSRFPEVAAMIGCEVARALYAAHQMGIIHRDVKPENIMVRRDGTVVLCDFGIARILDKDTVTTTGQLLGSPAYMAPEHIKGQPQDGRSDLFSLGVVLYEVLTGELPYRGRNPHETLVKIGAGEFVPVLEQAPLCSRELAAVVERTLSTDPAARPADAAALESELLTCLRDAGITDPRTELRSYFRDPAAWEAAFLPGCVTRLTECGQSLRRQGRVAAALQAWGRAQILAPEDQALQALIVSVARGQARRARLRRLLAAACGLALIAGGVSLGSRALHRRHRPLAASAQNPPSAPAAKAAVPELILGGSLRTAVLPPSALPAALQAVQAVQVKDPPQAGAGPNEDPPGHALLGRPHRHLPPKPVAVQPLAVVRLEPWPKAVSVTHNGKLLGEYGTDVRTVALVPEGNEFLFENPACYSERVVLPPGSTQEEIRVRLRWKPALLMVRARGPQQGEGAAGAPSADVMVDGHLVGRSGQVMALPVHADEGSQTVKIQVSAPGYQTTTREVLVHANQLTNLEVQLQSQ